MTNISRLESISPSLAESFRQASTSAQRQAVLEACVIATSLADLNEEVVTVAIEMLRYGNEATSMVRKQLEALKDRYDDQYFELYEKEDDAAKLVALRLFSKARVIAALVFALSEDSRQFHEALYEAIVAMEDPSKLIQAIEKVLQ